MNAVRASSNSLSGSSAGGWPQNVLPTSQAVPESCIRGIYFVLVNNYIVVSHLICMWGPGWGVLLYVITSPRTGTHHSRHNNRDMETGDKGSILQIIYLDAFVMDVGVICSEAFIGGFAEANCSDFGLQLVLTSRKYTSLLAVSLIQECLVILES